LCHDNVIDLNKHRESGGTPKAEVCENA
jgi:hypothetical protein